MEVRTLRLEIQIKTKKSILSVLILESVARRVTGGAFFESPASYLFKDKTETRGVRETRVKQSERKLFWRVLTKSVDTVPGENVIDASILLPLFYFDW